MKIQINNVQQGSYTTETQVVDGQLHLRVPVVMMTEGVHVGSQGAVLHRADNLTANAEVWKNQPVVINHPQHAGQFISVRDPNANPDDVVGYVEQISSSRQQLQGSIMLNVQKLMERDMQLYQRITAGELVEVSIGAFIPLEHTPGVHNNEPYEAVAQSYQPDHLALLPGDVGACSVQDGCGIRPQANKNQKDNTMTDENKKTKKDLRAVAAEVTGCKYAGMGLHIQANSEDLAEVMDMVHTYVDGMDNEHHVYFVDAVFDNYFVYRCRNRHTGEVTMHRQNYDFDEEGKLQTEAEPTAVQEVQYVEINTNQKKKEDMSMNKQKIDKVIQLTNHTEADRTALEGMEETQLDKMLPVEVEVDEPKLEVNKEVVQKFLADHPDDAITMLPEGVREKAQKGLDAYEANRAKLIQTIQTNQANVGWEEAELQALPDATLEKMAKADEVKKEEGNGPSNYAAATGDNTAPSDGDEVEPLGLPSNEPNKKEDK